MKRTLVRKRGRASVSVLIPCYNAAAYIGETLESIFSQGVDPHEVIVVDDGSTDWSAEVVRGFGKRVLYQRQSNGGISRARNAALALASGDTIAFLDADDVWPRGSLATRLDALLADPAAGYVYGVVEQFVSPELKEPLASMYATRMPARAPGRLAGAMLVRRSAFDQVGGFDTSLRVRETVDWVARADRLGISSRPLTRTVLRHRLHGSNTGLTQRASRPGLANAPGISGERKRAAS